MYTLQVKLNLEGLVNAILYGTFKLKALAEAQRDVVAPPTILRNVIVSAVVFPQ